MKKEMLENILLLIASIFFYVLFWQEKMGLNILIFDLVMMIFLWINKPEIIKNRTVLITALGTITTAMLIVWNNSLMSKIIHLISFIAMIGFAKQTELRFLGYSLLLTFITFFETPLRLIQKITKPAINPSFRLAPVWRSFRLSLVPLIVLLVFYGIYHLSNPEFRALSNSFWINFVNWFTWDISLLQILFFITGILISGAILFKSDFPIFKNLQNKQHEQLIRLKRKYPTLSRGMIALKSEFQSGLILLFSLNLLLLIVNVLDIKNYWLGTKYDLPPVEMKAMVHEGTYLLIAALLLAMVIISFFFRKNLNFFPKNSKIKLAGYCWIVQNTILAITLFIKNFRYIEANGLAYKRIGVLIFLVLVFAGLITMIIKIKERKTFYYLLHRNAWIAYSLFIVCCFINWDILITKYNLSHQTKNEIDFSFLIDDISDKNIYLLLEHEKNNLIPENRRKALRFAFRGKKETFLRKQPEKTWLSWNFADSRNLKYLSESD